MLGSMSLDQEILSRISPVLGIPGRLDGFDHGYGVEVHSDMPP